MTERAGGTIVDPGHGAGDSGASYNGLVEAPYVYALGQRVVPVLIAAGFESALSRNRDEDPSLRERSARAEELGASLAVSLHLDAAVDDLGAVHPEHHGAHVFFAEGNGRAERIAEDLEAALPAEIRRRTGGLVALPPHSADWPRAAAVVYGYRRTDAILLELGFVTSPTDVAYLRLQTTPGRLVAAILAGVARAAQVYGRCS